MSRGTEGDGGPGGAPEHSPELVQAVNDLKGRLHLLFEMAPLTALERLLCRRIYLGGDNPDDVADDIGLSFEDVRKLYRSALTKLRRQMDRLPKSIRTEVNDPDLEA